MRKIFLQSILACLTLMSFIFSELKADEESRPYFDEKHLYIGPVDISFYYIEEDGLKLEIETHRLILRSVEEKDLESYVRLFSDPCVVAKYANGQIKTREETKMRFSNWITRWKKCDPFSAIAILKKSDQIFIGHIILGHGEEPGQSEIAIILHQEYWNQGLGTEALTAVVQNYAALLAEQKVDLDGAPFSKILATARFDNPECLTMLKKVGMKLIESKKSSGALRGIYMVMTNELKPNISSSR